MHIRIVYGALSIGWLCARRTEAGLPNDDWSDIKKYYALGDSYAAGPGSGHIDPERSCRRFDKSYPYFIARDQRFGSMGLKPGRPGKGDFVHLGCSGATPSDILHKQLQRIPDGRADLITLTNGGNYQRMFFHFLHNCLYSFFLKGHPQMCLESLHSYNVTLPTLWRPLDDVLAASVAKLSLNGILLMTGYAEMFDDTTVECDALFIRKQPWNKWRKNHDTQGHLTQEMRSTANGLIALLNRIIETACEAYAPKCAFVDISKSFTNQGGRFCETGFIQTRPGTEDVLDDRPGALLFKDSGSPDYHEFVDHFGNINSAALLWAMSHDLHLLPRTNAVKWAKEKLERLLRLMIPTRDMKISHPNTLGHAVIAAALKETLQAARANFVENAC